jgi:hypothetical protein
MNLVPVTLDEAKEYVRLHHRHNKPPLSWKFGVGLEVDETLVGVVVAGRCTARPLDKKENIEVTRCCVSEAKNGNSRLYGAITRAAAALGYKTAYTYTLQTESGASLKADGWEIDAYLDARPTWDCPSRPRMQTNMFGEETRPAEPKIRWRKNL